MAQDPTKLIRIKRRFEAAPERLFSAWLNPETARKWLFTTPESQAHETKIDARVGGQWAITDKRDGVEYRAIGEYLEIDPPRGIVFTFAMPQFSDAVNKVIVDIAPDGTGSLLTLTQIGLETGSEDATRTGWNEMLDQLAALMAIAPAEAGWEVMLDLLDRATKPAA